jgi:hypothetical protein
VGPGVRVIVGVRVGCGVYVGAEVRVGVSGLVKVFTGNFVGVSDWTGKEGNVVAIEVCGIQAVVRISSITRTMVQGCSFISIL